VLAQLQAGLNNATQQNAEEAVIREFHRDIAEVINEINAIRQVIEGRAD
jgi:flagellar biosynthesis/type III secretory pathway protein FliH